MSHENVEIMRRAVEAFPHGEWSDVAASEIEWDLSASPGLDLPVRGRGREGFIQLMDRYVRAWTDYEVAAKELIDAGDDVVVVNHERVRARGTELLIERNLVHVWTLRDGKAVRLRTYPTKHEALEAAGLAE
jgi:ketosteroid isomerase-like protein